MVLTLQFDEDIFLKCMFSQSHCNSWIFDLGAGALVLLFQDSVALSAGTQKSKLTCLLPQISQSYVCCSTFRHIEFLNCDNILDSGYLGYVI